MQFSELWTKGTALIDVLIEATRRKGIKGLPVPNWTIDGRVEQPIMLVLETKNDGIVCGKVRDGKPVTIKKQTWEYFYDTHWDVYKAGGRTRNLVRD